MRPPNIRLSVITIISLTLLTACSTLQGRKDNVYDSHNIVGMAWNQDTVNPYRIIFYKNNAFSYTVQTSPKPKIQEINIYEGTYTISPDTVYLTFKDKRKPLMCDYLIQEMSGGYFIQYFRDNRPRMLLRKVHAPQSAQ
jgi:hypothetical protein